ncbi:phosphoadenosine phosphosulfate reductase family protein, partial [Deinococcus sp. 14RED07]|uniref:phosphoadenosine phosphosulfate reductase domain-containing protein n=1 Tax=Deinococcus sp. 14RED07 TaxID=2745874 RepID=UPI001E4EB0FE
MTTLSPRPDFTPDSDPLDVIRWALAAHGRVLMPSAFNLNGVVLIDLAAKAGYRGEVVFVDTGYHFPETLATRDRLAARYPELTFVTLNDGANPEDGQTDPALYAADADACCAVRKVAPLQAYLRAQAPDALLNARSRDQATTRADIPFVEQGARVKVNPLAHWTRERLEAYAREHDLPVNP